MNLKGIFAIHGWSKPVHSMLVKEHWHGRDIVLYIDRLHTSNIIQTQHRIRMFVCQDELYSYKANMKRISMSIF